MLVACCELKVFLGSAEEEMPISHKIRQYRVLLGFAHLGKVPRSAERGWGSRAKQGIWWGFMHQILVVSLRGGWGLVSLNKAAVHHWWFPSGSGCQADIPTHPDIPTSLIG